MLKRFSLHILLIAASTLAVAVPAYSAPEGEFLDSTSPQVIQKISGNIVTFKDSQGTVRDYYVPTWMLTKYSLKEGTSATLYNRNVIQGSFKGSYIDVANSALPENTESFAIHDTRKNCTLRESPASIGLGSGKRVWYKEECCPSTLPVVGAMSFYQKREIVVERTERQVIPPAQTPAPVYEEPVRGRG